MNKQSQYTERVHLRMNAEEKQMILDKANQAEMNVSDYLRALINNRRIVVAPELPKLAVQIIKIGVNANQICNVAKKCGTVSPERIAEVEKRYSDIQDLLRKLIAEIQERKDRTPPKFIQGVKQMNRISQVEVNKICRETLRTQFDTFFRLMCKDITKGSPSERERSQRELKGIVMFCGSLQAFTEQEEQDIYDCIYMNEKRSNTNGQ